MATKSVNVIKGSDRTFNIRIINKSSGDPKSLSGISGSNLKLSIPKDDGSVLELTEGSGLTVLSALGGKIQVSLTDAQTALLKAKDCQSMELTIIEGSVTSIVQFLKALNVKAGVFDDE